jgi:hypothetical protein
MLTLSSFIAPRATPCHTGRKPSLKVAGFDPFPTGWFYPTADNGLSMCSLRSLADKI